MAVRVLPTAVGADNIMQDVATPQQLAALARALESAHTAATYQVVLNYATGSCESKPPSSLDSVTDVVGLLRHGYSFVDYGSWPWGSCPVTPYSLGGGGFGQFLYQAGVHLAPPPAGTYSGAGTLRALGATAGAAAAVAAAIAGLVYGGAVAAAGLGAAGAAAGGSVPTIAAGVGATGIAGARVATFAINAARAFSVARVPVALAGAGVGVLASLPAGVAGLIARAAQHDPYSFLRANWDWGSSIGYPYAYGLPTTTNLANHPDQFRVGPGPVGQISIAGAPTIYMYSSFAIRVGRAWYFFAVPQIDPHAYAGFIVATLTGANAGTATHGAPFPTPPEARAHCLNVVVRQGSTGPYVAALQRALIDHGFGVGPNGADGVFGPDTYQGLVTFERANAGRTNPCGQIVVDGVAGPAVWYALGVTALPVPSIQTVPASTAHAASTTRRAPAKKAQHPAVSPKGVWRGTGANAVPYAVVGGKYVRVTVPQSGGVVVVDGYKVHFGPAPTQGIGGLLRQDLVDPIAQTLHVSPTTVELLGAALGAGAIILAVTSGGGQGGRR